ncbi:glycoside hydrolase family 5 protein [Tautonia plasticadhaerens]|uniref:Endoglucanase H n=1 Tax=Tautonia plasticadhaerens TaxID=2527974 RepID=A0A518HB74_9BACT|nr:glycoside hydrolase family 5 protein [Tautonia plasticadhaerens]QDV38110.1 Endoglucanase H precursor [Tautonia plasticadhaerens]
MTPPRSTIALTVFATLAAMAGPSASPAADEAAVEANGRLGRGINLGNALEAPRGQSWGMEIRDDYFEQIKRAGFDSVRIPIRWSDYASDRPPYAIDPGFFEQVDGAIDSALSRGLTAVINFHHIEPIYEDPAAFRDAFLALWGQVAERYRDRPETLVFEILNEPHANLDAASWNDLIPEALGVIRESNPDRVVIVGPAGWNNFRELDTLELPDDDRLIVTFHYYEPFPFTHQGAEWNDPVPPVGVEWTGSDEEQAEVTRAFDRVSSWAEEHGRPIYLGEFGAYNKADMESRARWTALVAREAERRGFSWAYWEFGSGFGAFDRESGRWRPELLRALVPDSPTRGR